MTRIQLIYISQTLLIISIIILFCVKSTQDKIINNLLTEISEIRSLSSSGCSEEALLNLPKPSGDDLENWQHKLNLLEADTSKSSEQIKHDLCKFILYVQYRFDLGSPEFAISVRTRDRELAGDEENWELKEWKLQHKNEEESDEAKNFDL